MEPYGTHTAGINDINLFSTSGHSGDTSYKNWNEFEHRCEQRIGSVHDQTLRQMNRHFPPFPHPVDGRRCGTISTRPNPMCPRCDVIVTD
ncbi:hypothetical protein CHS0354_033462 [Potamilus streckersoni]|uniref:Uncharacterized protein n=1 Tax=Potamilus streckersoni TaxID=2493646 RepID=A0AAE0VUS7_9BIVA|nr:hypothetical protein CHS0354_033462 [Potamilus streckersoni]